MIENFAVIGGLTLRIKDLERKHSELESKNFPLNLLPSSIFCPSLIIFPLSYLIDLEKIKEEVVTSKARIALLEEENQTKDRSIAEASTRDEAQKKKIEGNWS